MIFVRSRSVKEILETILDGISEICGYIEETGLARALDYCSNAESIVQELIAKRKFSAEDLAKAFDRVIYELSNAVSDIVQILTEEINELNERVRWCND